LQTDGSNPHGSFSALQKLGNFIGMTYGGGKNGYGNNFLKCLPRHFHNNSDSFNKTTEGGLSLYGKPYWKDKDGNLYGINL
jgi:hypothetical protein